jgi:hypothetical protein
VATLEFRLIREHTRCRRDLTAERARAEQRAEKLPESAAIKISSVITDPHGMTGRDIMDRLIAGERDPRVLAGLARGKARPKAGRLAEALEAEFFTGEHAALLKVMLERIDRTGAGIARLSQVIEELLAPYEEQLQQAGSMPGWGRRAAQDVIAETGADMSRFPAPGHLASWAGRTPLDRQSGQRAGRTGPNHGNRYIGAVTGETAASAGRPQTRALGNTQMRVYHVLLANPGMRHADLGPDYYDQQRHIARQVSHHVGKLASLGYEVTLTRHPEPDPPGHDTQAA